MLSCLSLCLASCASKPVRTQTAEVKVPVYVALPSEFFGPCMVPDPNNPKALIAFDASSLPSPLTNGTLAQYALNIKACLAATNDRLTRIKALQP